jgi:error-prone DNA polymerase
MCDLPVDAAPDYAELHCLSNFSFLRGASHPEELVDRAIELGYHALAITDECSLSGVVRAYSAVKAATARGQSIRLIIGSEFRTHDGLHLVLLAPDRKAYAQLSALITRARRDCAKGDYQLDRAMLEDMDLRGCLALWIAPPSPFSRHYCEVAARQSLEWLSGLFSGRLWIGAQRFLDADDRDKQCALQQLSQQTGVPVCATGGIQMHHPSRRALRDTLTAIRLGKPLAELGYQLPANAQQFLRSRDTLARLFPAAWLAETLKIAGQCVFSLSELRYEYPRELVPAGHTPASWLRRLTLQGMKERWTGGVSQAVRELVEKELALIAEMAYEHFFLTVHDIVMFARSQNILCQGRGSAANSAVCYCLGITAVDPSRMQLLFERFLSKERDEPPDIDVDFEHERREEVIQYIYRKYGRDRAAMTAVVHCYRPRGALREAGKVFGLSGDVIAALSKAVWGWRDPVSPQTIRDELGLDPDAPALRRTLAAARALQGFPRHLSQHPGGFVMTLDRLDEMVPVRKAAMPERTAIEWDKEDIDALGLLKVDVLALGMLTVIRRALALTAWRRGLPMFRIQDIPRQDVATFEMISQADTVGVFQIESRAQMNMLPRLKPREFYDLVIEVAIVRPGPIQGGMVHPYLRRRQGLEPITYPSDAVRAVLERTLGVPIFQEQVMKLAMVAAGFTAGEADSLRRAMAAS